jgi:hypothetical protein
MRDRETERATGREMGEMRRRKGREGEGAEREGDSVLLIFSSS